MKQEYKDTHRLIDLDKMTDTVRRMHPQGPVSNWKRKGLVLFCLLCRFFAQS